MPVSTQTLFDNVCDAINQLIGDGTKKAVSTYQIGNVEYTYIDLDSLRKWKRELQDQLNAATINAGGVRPFKVLGIRPSRPT